MSEICTRAIGKPSFAAASIWRRMYSISSSCVRSRSRRMPMSAFTASDVGTRPTSSTRSRNQPAKRSSIVGEAAEAREPDDLETGAVALGRDLADQALEVVLAGVEGPREAVEGDALDRRAERGAHACNRLHGLGVVLLDVEHPVVADDDVRDVELQVDVDLVLGIAGLRRGRLPTARPSRSGTTTRRSRRPAPRTGTCGRSWSSAASPRRQARRRCGGPHRRCTSRAARGTTGCGPRPRRDGRLS